MSDKRVTFTRPDGGVSVLIPAPGVPLKRVLQDVPEDAINVKVVAASDLPADRTFRDAWSPCSKNGARVDVEKAKGVCHAARRAKRAAEFAPLDAISTSPLFAVGAEADRQKVRDKHANLQTRIDAATDEAALRAVLADL